MADWGNLPRDLLVLIAQKLTFMEDLIRLSASCKAWFQSTESLISGKDKLLLPSGLPCLILLDNVNDKVTSSQIMKKRSEDIKPGRLFNLSSGKTYEFELPEVSGRKCLGPGHGWLLTLGVDLNINLLHLFWRQQIPLPPMLALPTPYVYSDIFWPEEAFDKFIDKAALSANPMSSHNGGISVMVIYGENSELAVSKLGDKVWTRVHIPRQGVPNGLPVNFDDVVFYRGKYYVVDFTGVVYVCDLNGDKGPSATAIAAAPSGTEEWIQKYLVEFSGDLLLVQRVRGGDSTPGQSLPDHVVFDSDDEEEEEETEESDDYTVKFEVLKLEESSGEEGRPDPYGWVKVSSLGNQSLWIGGEQSVSISDLKGCIKPNCIYFTDEYGGRDNGIFHMDSGKTEPLLQPTYRHR